MINASDLSIPIGSVRSWKMRVVQARAEIEELEREIADTEAKLAAISHLFPDIDLEHIASQPDADTWPGMVLYLAEDEDRGREPRELLDKAREMPEFADKTSVANPTGFYNAISRLAERGDIKRRGTLVYSKKLWKAIEAGEVEDVAWKAAERAAPPIREYILEKMRGRGFIAPKVIGVLISDEQEIADRLARNPQYLYTLLGRMVRKKELVKRDSTYALSSEAEAPNGNADGASKAEGVAAPSADTSSLFRVVK